MQFVTTTAKNQLLSRDGNVAPILWYEMEYGRRKNGVQPGMADETKITPKTALRKRSVVLRSDTFTQSLLSFREVDSAKRTFKVRLQRLSIAVACLGVLAALLAILDLEFNMRIHSQRRESASKSLKDPTRAAQLVVSSILSLVSVLTCALMFWLHTTELRLLVVKNIYHQSESLWTTALLPTCLLENAICLFHVPPLVAELGVPYKLQLLVFLRIYLVTRYVKEHSRFINNKGTAFFASVTKTEITSTFLIKAYFLKYSFTLISIVYVLNVFLGGYLVYVIEETLCYMDVIWMLVVTMTTLGFGDVVPVSFVARAFVGFSSILGIFLMALFISVVHETLQLRQLEKRILSTTESAEISLGKKNSAAACIQSAWRLHIYTIKNLEALELGHWFKATKWRYLQHRMWMRQRQWRLERRSYSADEYWKKLFLAEDTAMTLTDVYRTVNNIELHISKPPFPGRKISRTSSRKISVSSPIMEETTEAHESEDSLPSLCPQHCTSNHGNHRIECIRPRSASEPISTDALERKIESFERSLDDVFRKVTSELRDIKDSIEVMKSRCCCSQGTMCRLVTHNVKGLDEVVV